MTNEFRCGQSGVSLTGIIIALIIVGFVAFYMIGSLFSGTGEVRDRERKEDLNKFQYILKEACYFPPKGAGEYDLAEVFAGIKASAPQYGNVFKSIPFDPARGSEKRTNYIYTVSLDGRRCSVFVNLENENEPVTLTIQFPTPGSGTGVIESKVKGVNGSHKYYQVSN